MRTLKRFVMWIVSRVRKVIEPDFTVAHYPAHASAHVRYPDYRHDGLPNRPRGNYREDFLGGVPPSQDPNATLAGFPRRTIMVAYHGWSIPTPPQLPVYD